MYLSFRGDPAWTTNFIRRESASFELATEADQFIKKRLLRLANNYDEMTTTKTKRDQAVGFPVVYMTGASARDWKSKGVVSSILIEKPFAPAQLANAVSQLLDTGTSPG